MNFRKTYGSEKTDAIFCFFMKTILRLQKYGRSKINIDINIDENISCYLNNAMRLIEDAQPPEIFDLVLDIEFMNLIKESKLTKEDIGILILIKKISYHLAFDGNLDFFMSTSNLWNEKANEYAIKTFYYNLPEKSQKKHGLDSILNSLPQELLNINDF